MSKQERAAGEPGCGGASRRDGWVIIGVALLAALGMVGASLALRAEWPQAVRVAVALAPVALLGWMMVAVLRASRRVDELYQRIQLEALAMTVGLSVLLVVGWGQLQKVGVLPLCEMSFAWPAIALVYVVCYGLARRRYG